MCSTHLGRVFLFLLMQPPPTVAKVQRKYNLSNNLSVFADDEMRAAAAATVAAAAATLRPRCLRLSALCKVQFEWLGNNNAHR